LVVTPWEEEDAPGLGSGGRKVPFVVAELEFWTEVSMTELGVVFDFPGVVAFCEDLEVSGTF
jgi:hypothetical protein